ncbi:hypothetical protein [Klebsiella aerogenes]|uniref:hypothetical protein n=1 Tax=Klebsiella aerogenes TaxID=548 RepID=UPI0021CEA538|nr:hypothetical protein [Klebsiella aerogenes]MCU6317016.1 hypothetical protein [Klebsiella aerogenes]
MKNKVINFVLFFCCFPFMAQANAVYYGEPTLDWNGSVYKEYIPMTLHCDKTTFTATKSGTVYCAPKITFSNGDQSIWPPQDTSCNTGIHVYQGNPVNFPDTTCSYTAQLVLNESATVTEVCALTGVHVTHADGQLQNFQTVASTCASTPQPPPPNVTCQLSDVTIDYKNLSPDEYNGNKMQGSGSIRCTGADTSLVLSFSNPQIQFNTNNTVSNLLFSNGSESERIDAKDNVAEPFTVISTLSGTPSNMGPFSGSTVILFSVE